MQESFQSMPFDRIVFENVPSIILQPKSAWCVLFGGFWRKPLEILRGDGKAYVKGLRHACRSTEKPGETVAVLVGQHAWCWVLQIVAVAHQTSTTLVAKSVISLATCAIPICRWIASEDHPVDEPFRSERDRPNTHLDVDQCGPSATGSAPDSELLAVLSAEAARVASEEAETRKRSRVRSCAGVADQSRGEMEQARSRREERGRVRTRAHAAAASLACQHSLFGESSFLEENRVTAATFQRYTVTLNEFLAFSRMTMDELKLLAKLHEMLVELLERDAGGGHYSMAAVKFQSFPNLLRAVRALKGDRRLAPGMSRGPLPWVAAAAMMGVTIFGTLYSLLLDWVSTHLFWYRPRLRAQIDRQGEDQRAPRRKHHHHCA